MDQVKKRKKKIFRSNRRATKGDRSIFLVERNLDGKNGKPHALVFFKNESRTIALDIDNNGFVSFSLFFFRIETVAIRKDYRVKIIRKWIGTGFVGFAL